MVSFLAKGFSRGFSLGFQGQVLPGIQKNLRSASQHKEGVTEAIMKEVRRGHIAGPFLSPPLPHLHCSPLGGVPKPDGTIRLILNLSAPHNGSSVNEGIDKESYSVKYSHFDEAVDIVRHIGKGTYMAKIDIRHAFRICPVALEELYLLGMHWKGYYFVDTRLPFGGRSSPFIFNSLADALCWILINIVAIKFVIHYLDDFFLAAASKSGCEHIKQATLNLFEYLGIPIAEDKLVGPSSCITYLGLEIDACKMEIRLPSEKLKKLKIDLKQWLKKASCTKRELLSLIGKLAFASKVIKPGRIFVRRLIEASTTVDSLGKIIVLDPETKADIIWWDTFVQEWNGISIIQEAFTSSETLQFYTDASGSKGYGAIFGKKWLWGEWPESHRPLHINIKELLAIIIAVETWGHLLYNKQIIIHTDNKTICAIWKKGSSTDPHLMKLVRHLFLFCSQNNFNVTFQHIPGLHNVLADSLSRLQVDRFRSLHPEAETEPSVVPHAVWRI